VGIAKTATRRSLALASLARKLAKEEIKNLFTSREKTLLRLKQAKHLVESLGQLKGSAMKMGQLLALEAREFLPQEVVAVLDQLQNQASFMDHKQVVEILREELKENFKHLENISEKPIAAASIGQVHTAQVSGKKVAVKVQYPGISETIDSDIKIVKNLAAFFSVVGGKSNVDFNDLFDEVRQVTLNETRYLEEASATKKFKGLIQGIPSLQVPEVFDDLTTDRVITMSFENGKTLSECIKSGELDSGTRLFYGKLFLELYTRELCQWGFVQTDPNLGNFLLDVKNLKLTLLDFGATRSFSEDFRRQYAQLILSGLSLNRKALLEQCVDFKIMDPREGPTAQDAFIDLIITSMNPFRSPHFDFSNSDYSNEMRKKGAKLVALIKFSPPPKQIIFLHRKLGGIFQILRRLEVTLDLRPYIEPHRQILEGKEFKL
jgi:predicted unusual protein kinase regulating ubiquinone biosynthesis (AarF/ABC1/UbiB family)